jgi:3-hydroxyisobutyrate dehydrogenase-like beta-hydroxyacid dehydrogenase
MRLGFLGAGVMGRGMVLNLVGAGHEVHVYNRSRERLAALVGRGAIAAETPAQAAAGADAVLSCVTDAAAVASVWQGPEGALQAMAAGTLAIDLSTIGPSASKALAEACASRTVAFVDAPVTGGEGGARDGVLTVFAAGAAEALDRAWPLFEAIGRRIHRVGVVGDGQAVKLIQNLVGGLNLLAAAEGVAVAEAVGLSGREVLAMLGETTSQSRSAEILLERLGSGNTEPGFSTRNRLKDFSLALELAHGADCPLPLSAAGIEIFWSAMARGLAELDQTAVQRVAGRGAWRAAERAGADAPGKAKGRS